MNTMKPRLGPSIAAAVFLGLSPVPIYAQSGVASATRATDEMQSDDASRMAAHPPIDAASGARTFDPPAQPTQGDVSPTGSLPLQPASSSPDTGLKKPY
jgi:hypothetical protein